MAHSRQHSEGVYFEGTGEDGTTLKFLMSEWLMMPANICWTIRRWQITSPHSDDILFRFAINATLNDYAGVEEITTM